jgi:hypothetical protein
MCAPLLQYLTGKVPIDQPLILDGGINIVPTDGNGVTLARTPQQVICMHWNTLNCVHS